MQVLTGLYSGNDFTWSSELPDGGSPLRTSWKSPDDSAIQNPQCFVDEQARHATSPSPNHRAHTPTKLCGALAYTLASTPPLLSSEPVLSTVATGALADASLTATLASTAALRSQQL